MFRVWYGYILGAAMLVVGVLVLLGVVMTLPQPGMVRTIFGVVLMLFGVYRIVLADGGRRQLRREGGADQ